MLGTLIDIPHLVVDSGIWYRMRSGMYLVRGNKCGELLWFCWNLQNANSCLAGWFSFRIIFFHEDFCFNLCSESRYKWERNVIKFQARRLEERLEYILPYRLIIQLIVDGFLSIKVWQLIPESYIWPEFFSDKVEYILFMWRKALVVKEKQDCACHLNLMW